MATNIGKPEAGGLELPESLEPLSHFGKHVAGWFLNGHYAGINRRLRGARSVEPLTTIGTHSHRTLTLSMTSSAGL